MTDEHKQCEEPVKELLKTMAAYGQAAPELFTTDKPATDKPFFLSAIPSLKIKQNEFDATHTNADVHMENELPLCTLTPDRLSLISQPDIINRSIDSMRNLVLAQPISERVLSLDCEWDTTVDSRGIVSGRASTVAVISLSYRAGGIIKALVIQVYGLKKLPDRLLALFRDTSITFTGRMIGGDLSKIGRDFNIGSIMSKVKRLDIGPLARARDVVRNGTASLQQIVRATLKEDLDKSVRLSKWSAKILTDEQKYYAALDVIKALEVYFSLMELPDLTSRLSTISDATVGMSVDVVPSHGCVSILATRAAIGKVTDVTDWACTLPGCKPQTIKTNKKNVCVTITEVTAPSLIVPRLKMNGKKVCLADFGEAPFQVVLPLTMLKHHVESLAVRITPTAIINTDANMVDSPAVLIDADEDENEYDEVRYDIEGRPIDYDDDDPERETSFNADEAATRITNVTVINHELTLEESSLVNEMLGDSPESINDKFSSVLGDAFHFMDRPKVPIHHEMKKAYFVALRDAWFAFDTEKLAALRSTLLASGMTEKEINAEMYFNFDYFRQRVPRVVLPPSQLYRRVRAVYAVYGQMLDSKTGTPLFNKANWKKAKNVLSEILEGHASDPPGISFYQQRITARGELAFDSNGIALLDCNRGSNDTECVHKQIVTTFGTWCTGVEMSDYLLAEFRHRYNQHISERRRLGFPRLGHYDTWLVDLLQKLVERNHNVLYVPEWSNASDYIDTTETFGTVPIHSEALDDAIAAIDLDATLISDKPRSFTSDQMYLCEAMRTKLPLLPVHGEKEYILFNRLMLAQTGSADFDQMAIEWCKYVDGYNIFPKLPVYLRTYFTQWQHNQRVRDAVENSVVLSSKLKDINAATERRFVSPPLIVTSTSNEVAPVPEPHAIHVAVHHHVPMPPAPTTMPESSSFILVGGLNIGVTSTLPDVNATRVKKTKGQRGGDGKPRASRRCTRCLKNGMDSEAAMECEGRWGEVKCEHFE